jgi:hypothetical protein
LRGGNHRGGSAARIEIQAIHIGDAASAVHDAVALKRDLLAVLLEGGAELDARLLHPLHIDAGMDLDAEALALLAYLFHGVRIERRQEPGQDLKNSNLQE